MNIKHKNAAIFIILCVLFVSGCGKTLPENEITEESMSVQENTAESSISKGEIADNGEVDTSTIPWFPAKLEDRETAFSGGEFEPISNIAYADILNNDREKDFAVITNDTDLYDLLTEVDTPYYHIIPGIALIGYNTGFMELSIKDWSNGRFSKDNIFSHLPLNFLRKTDNYNYYTVYKLKDGGLIYYFFGPCTMRESRDTHPYDTDNIGFYGSIYAENKLSYDDFRNIKIGSSIADVKEVDNAIMMTLLYYRYSRDIRGRTAQTKDGTPALLLLEDGLLELVFETKTKDYYTDKYGIERISNEAEDLVVKRITYYPDFQYRSTFYEHMQGTDYIPVSLKVLPQDYPPAN